MSSSRQFTYYEFRLYMALGSSAVIAALSILNLHKIVTALQDFSKSGQSPTDFEKSTNINVKKFEQEFIVFFSLAAFSLSIFVLVFSQLFRVIDGVFYQNLYNRFTFILATIVLIGLTCYSTSVYKNISSTITGSPIIIVNTALLIILFLIFFYSLYQFYRSTETVSLPESSSTSREKNNDSFLSFLFPPKQSQYEKLQKQNAQLQQKQRLQDLKNEIKTKKSRIEMKKRSTPMTNVTSPSQYDQNSQQGIQMTNMKQ